MPDAPPPPAVPPPRQAVRALLVTPERELLLLRTAPPHLATVLWIAPGGGIEAGETAEQALVREVREETGHVATALGPVVWTRCHSYRWGAKLVTQAERYFLVPSPRFAPTTAGLTSPAERREVVGFRWWRPEELAASDERFVPLRLATHLAALLAGGVPATPVDVGG